jgi:hypothetical protein
MNLVNRIAASRSRVWAWGTGGDAYGSWGGTALRFVLAVTVLAPAAVATLLMGAPFAISAIASTTAIILHAPHRYHQRPQPILACYVAGLCISAPMSIAAAWVGAPALLAAALSAIIVVATRPGKVHPPTACIPLAIATPSADLWALQWRWVSFTLLAFTCLTVLWVLTVERLCGPHESDPSGSQRIPADPGVRRRTVSAHRRPQCDAHRDSHAETSGIGESPCPAKRCGGSLTCARKQADAGKITSRVGLEPTARRPKGLRR